MKALVFTCDEYDFAFEIDYIKEIKNWSQPTPFPASNRSVEGIINIRGEIIPVLNLFSIMGYERSFNKKAIIVVDCMNKQVAFSVSSVRDILNYDVLKTVPEGFHGEINCISGFLEKEGDSSSIFLMNLNAIIEKFIINE